MRKKSMGKSQCFISNDLDGTEKERIRKNVCRDLPVNYKSGGQNYCILHFPNDQKHMNTDFNIIVSELLDAQDYVFEYCYFSDVFRLWRSEGIFHANFRHAIFLQDALFGGTVYLNGAIFDNAIFKSKAHFGNATFDHRASFNHVIFAGTVDFRDARFNTDAHFSAIVLHQTAYLGATFNQSAFFRYANFEENSEVFFDKAIFKRSAYFRDAKFKGYLVFDGTKENPVFVGDSVRIDLEDAYIENPERVVFKNVRLQPNWFVCQEKSRNFVFMNCSWTRESNTRLRVKLEIDALARFKNPVGLLRAACWQLADNYEEKKGFEEASMFREMANESKRLESFMGLEVWSLHWWYWLSSVYAESWRRALLVLGILILLFFPSVYKKVSFRSCSKDRPISASLSICESKDEEISKNCTCSVKKLTFPDAIVQSLTTATLQNVEYRKPLTGWGEFWIIMEKIFVPLQAALLALAIRRKFMR